MKKQKPGTHTHPVSCSLFKVEVRYKGGKGRKEEGGSRSPESGQHKRKHKEYEGQAASCTHMKEQLGSPSGVEPNG